MAITTKSEAVRVPEQSVESSASAVEWAAIVGGAIAAIGITIILFTLGSGLGLSTVSPWSWSNPSPTTFGVVAGIWLIVTQWLASALGGYLTGRLRTKWVGIRTDEVFFRDTAHGFLAWALATVLMATFFTLAASAVAAVPEATGTRQRCRQRPPNRRGKPQPPSPCSPHYHSWLALSLAAWPERSVVITVMRCNQLNS